MEEVKSATNMNKLKSNAQMPQATERISCCSSSGLLLQLTHFSSCLILTSLEKYPPWWISALLKPGSRSITGRLPSSRDAGEGAQSYERVHRGPSSILCLSWDTLYMISHKYTFFLVTSSLFLRGYLSRPVWQLWTGLKYSWYNRHDISFLTMMIKTTMMMKLYADDRWKIQPLHLRSFHSKHCAPQQGRLSRLST